MKKILAGFVSASLIFAATVTPTSEVNKVYAFTIESDAQTAVEKNQKSVLAALWRSLLTQDRTAQSVTR